MYLIKFQLHIDESPKIDGLDPTDRTTSWMEILPDCWHLLGLSLPGTHNSLTWDVNNSCNNILTRTCCNCQDMVIKQQLASGIRVFDIRPAYDKTYFKDIRLWHGDFALYVNLVYVFKILSNFLLRNKSETVILMFKCWWDDVADDSYCGEKFVDTFLQNIQDVGKQHFYPSWPRSENSPRLGEVTLGEVRGKIVLFNQNFRSKQDRIPSISTDGQTYFDKWTIDDWDKYYASLSNSNFEAKKFMYSKGGAACPDETTTFYVTWFNANNCKSNAFHGPGYISEYVNYELLHLIRCSRTKPVTDITDAFQAGMFTSGITMMDFPDGDIIKQIVSENFWHLLFLRKETGSDEACKFSVLTPYYRQGCR